MTIAENAAATPIRSLRVVEIGERLAVAYCGKLLRDAGATVVVAEPPGGHRLRHETVSGVRPPPGRNAPLFDHLAAGKQSVVVDGEVPSDVLAGADMVILGATPTAAADLGIDVVALLAESPDLIVVTISDFGWTGPWVDRAATEYTLQAFCGSSGFRGSPGTEPLSVGGDVGEYMGGVLASFAAQSVRRRVLAGGPGEHLDMSMLEAMTLTMQSCEWLHQSLMDLTEFTRSTEVPSVEQAADGYVAISMVTGQQWQDFTAMVGCPELADEPELQRQLGRWDHRDRIRALTGPWMRSRTVAEIVHLGELFRLPIAAIGNGSIIAGMDHMVERGVFVDTPSGFRAPRAPWRMSEAVPAPTAPSPRLGDNESDPSVAERHAGATAPTELPLAGLRVLDLTAFWAGPSATHLLAAFGAEVIKIESIQRPDGIRYSGGMKRDVDDWWEYGWLFQGVNTNKRSVTLDLQSPSGRAVLMDLIAQSDLLMENFSPRVMEQFGLSHDEVAAVNPRLTYVRMPAFGLDGPWRDRIGFAPTMESLAGLAWLTGHPDGAPTPPRGACDPLAGAHAAFAALCAVEHAARTGRGQLVEVPMIESVLNVTAVQALEFQTCGALLTRTGNHGQGLVTQGMYRCAGEDDWLALTVRDDRDWAALCSELGSPQWAGAAELATADGRRENAATIHPRLRAWCRERPVGEVVEQFAAAGIPVAHAVVPYDVTDNPQLRARGFFEPLDHPRSGPGLYPRPPFAPLTGHTRWVHSPAPTLGQHTREVLQKLCGLDEQALDLLAEQSVIGTRPARL